MLKQVKLAYSEACRYQNTVYLISSVSHPDAFIAEGEAIHRSRLSSRLTSACEKDAMPRRYMAEISGLW
jgi:hypothetical protein